mgnify:FL=1|tara:strand:+ start:765 stop:971 length:207 start_codon:yes stop_codon:yes gene_type:complete
MSNKFLSALKIVRPNTPMSFVGEIETEEDFKKVNWETGIDENGFSITTNTCPHSEITWTKIKTEMDKL